MGGALVHIKVIKIHPIPHQSDVRVQNKIINHNTINLVDHIIIQFQSKF